MNILLTANKCNEKDTKHQKAFQFIYYFVYLFCILSSWEKIKDIESVEGKYLYNILN